MSFSYSYILFIILDFYPTLLHQQAQGRLQHVEIYIILDSKNIKCSYYKLNYTYSINIGVFLLYHSLTSYICIAEKYGICSLWITKTFKVFF